MSLLKAIKAQLGLSNTPANNFTITAEADNGTLKLARGNAGATTQDILSVDANGNVLVDGNNLNLFSAKSLASSGYQKLPSGLIIQWGYQSSLPSGVATVALPIAFPLAQLGGYVAVAQGANTVAVVTSLTVSNITINAYNPATGAGVSVACFWLALGK